MRRTYTLLFLLVVTLSLGFAAGPKDIAVPVFGSRRAAVEVLPEIEVVPLGMTIGVRINTDGVMVLGTGVVHGPDGKTYNPSEDKLLAGDLVLKVNNAPVKDKEALEKLVAESQSDLSLLVRRNNIEMTVTLSPAVSAADNVRRIGAWVRDSTKGIGTLTFYDPATNMFGALGHGIMDVDTKLIMSVKNGIIMPSTVTSVKRGARGAPGELEGAVETNRVMGTVTANNARGIFGNLEASMVAGFPTEAVPVATRAQVQAGRATILTNAINDEVREFEIQIENVNRFAADETKSMVIRITDPDLLAVTGGIVQGMSGSPILQNGRIIGAVTHVFVQDPTKGYGIFIEYMIDGILSSAALV
ncbi:MAG: SpoIVB peptidase [Defluviitaleaceae bacterium]|nr:SpoIVB peptidase [Defluviitaleaceae bacterium]